MPTIERTATVPYSPDQMYQLVFEVERYPDFLPWCQSTRVLSRGAGEQVASITLAKGPLRQQFTTRNALEPGRRLGLALVSGPFTDLDGEWRFEPQGAQCRVSLSLRFTFSSRVLAATVGPVFTQITRSMVDAFSARARALYGEPGAR